MTALLTKTELGRKALAPGSRVLTPRERMLVLLADGQRTTQDLLGLLEGTPVDLVHGLTARGFLSSAAALQEFSPLPAAPASPQPLPSPGTSAAGSAAAPTSGSPWARSPAATKLYLMDLVERTFARADPAQWELLRDLLREARDDAGLLQATALVTQAIARAVGEERALLIRSQLLRVAAP